MENRWRVSLRHTETESRIIVKPPALYERVVLARDLPEFGIKRGDVATLVDRVPHPSGGPEGLVLEVTNALGDSIHVVIVGSADVEPLQANDVLTVRQLHSVASGG
jgi:hypothetical protein